MNSLVAYGADSDEELTPERRRSTATPPRQDKDDAAQDEALRKIQAKQRRKDSEHWADSEEEASDRSSKRSRDGSPRSDDSPGPLLRHALQPSGAGLRPVHSTSSLLNYGGTDVVDEFDKDFISSGSPHKPSATREPEPPKRPEDNDDSDRSPDELDMEQTEHVLDEGLRALKEHAGSREGSATPQREASTGAETPGRVEEIVGLPPSPPGQCSEEVEATFARCFERKARGANYNDQMKLRKDFRNPAIYEILVQKFNLDEKGSNFPESVYDPHAFSESDFYEALAEEQRKLTENAQAAAANSSKPKKKTRFGA